MFKESYLYIIIDKYANEAQAPPINFGQALRPTGGRSRRADPARRFGDPSPTDLPLDAVVDLRMAEGEAFWRRLEYANEAPRVGAYGVWVFSFGT